MQISRGNCPRPPKLLRVGEHEASTRASNYVTEEVPDLLRISDQSGWISVTHCSHVFCVCAVQRTGAQSNLRKFITVAQRRTSQQPCNGFNGIATVHILKVERVKPVGSYFMCGLNCGWCFGAVAWLLYSYMINSAYLFDYSLPIFWLSLRFLQSLGQCDIVTSV